MAGCEESFGFYFIFVLLTYLLWMDLSFFDELAVYGSNYNATIASKMMFPVKSVKLRMTEHIDHYINLPLMELSEEKLGISSIPGVTPNVISGFHFFCAVVACKFFISEHLAFRRIGCMIYEFRNQLDLLDGVVYRAQAHKKTFVSGWGSSGYLVDAAMDFGGGLLMAFSLGVFLHRFPPLKKVRVRKDIEAGVGLLSEHYPTKPEKTTYSFVHVDRRAITTTVLIAVLQVVGRSGFWDHFVRSYHELLELPNPHYPKVGFGKSLYSYFFLYLRIKGSDGWEIFQVVHVNLQTCFFLFKKIYYSFPNKLKLLSKLSL